MKPLYQLLNICNFNSSARNWSENPGIAWKRTWFAIMIAYFLIGYLLTNWLAEHSTHYYDVSLDWEKSIPFMPFFIFGYLLVYVSIHLVYTQMKSREECYQAIISFFLATTIAFLVFIFIPVKMTMRPNIHVVSGISTLATGLFYFLDLPNNCFPSLHVAYAFLAILILRKSFIVISFGLTISISVVLVKQHYIADVLSGILLAIACYWAANLIIKAYKKTEP
ncbi:phosphatase PAP2 family protein [Patescibacteria group bacterium]